MRSTTGLHCPQIVTGQMQDDVQASSSIFFPLLAVHSKPQILFSFYINLPSNATEASFVHIKQAPE